MKRLLLLRHAQADGTSIDASVTAYGLLEAKKVGEFLVQNDIMPELVLCSPAKRAHTTYDRVFETIDKKPRLVLEDRLCGTSAGELIKRINAAPLEVNDLMIIGHNPAITSVIMEFKLLEHNELYLSALDTIPTCKLMSLVFQNTEWLTIQNEPCVIENVYWPSVAEVLNKKKVV
jgi:phosphohistidine phosphatase